MFKNSSSDFKFYGKNVLNGIYSENSAPFSRRRKEMQHFASQPTVFGPDFKGGLHAVGEITKENDAEYFLEDQMCRKKRVGFFESRNDHDVKSLGDKPYKFPDYQSDYFKHTINRKVNAVYTVKTENRSIGTTWKDKCKNDELEEQIKSVEELHGFANAQWSVWKEDFKKEKEKLQDKFANNAKKVAAAPKKR